MNSEQRADLLERVKELVGEHCNAFVFLADVDHEEYEEGKSESVMISAWDGGPSMAIGLIRRAQLYLESDDVELYRQSREEG